MTNIHLIDAPQSFTAKLKAVLPPDIYITDSDADILITFSGHVPSSTSSNAIICALAWGDGNPFISECLGEPASRPFAVIDLHLIRHNGNGWHTLYQASFSSVPGQKEATRQRGEERAVLLILKACKQASHKSSVPFSYLADQAHAPIDFLLYAKLLWRCLYYKVASIAMHENWMIGWIDQPIQNATTWTTLPSVQWIGPRSSKRYLADPFLFPGNASVVFCEEFKFSNKIGTLKRLTVEDNKILQEEEMALPLKGHLSYPYLFENEGGIFCLPESCEAASLILFRWNKGTREWEEYCVVLNGIKAADASLFKHDGKYWIAFTDVSIDPFDNLNLVYASSLNGPWQLHPQNPVSLNPKTSRCGGTIFEKDGMLIRPAQDCSRCYGGSIRLMHIQSCTTEDFIENEIAWIAPEKGMNPHGFHTLSAAGDRTLVDGKRMQFSVSHILGKIIRRMKSFVN